MDHVTADRVSDFGPLCPKSATERDEAFVAAWAWLATVQWHPCFNADANPYSDEARR